MFIYIDNIWNNKGISYETKFNSIYKKKQAVVHCIHFVSNDFFYLSTSESHSRRK